MNEVVTAGRASRSGGLVGLLDLFRLAVPIAISRGSVMLMSLTDVVMLGRYRPEELPYILNAWIPLGVALGLGFGIMMGVQVITAEMAGRGEQGDTGRVLRRGLVSATVLGLFGMLVVMAVAGPLFRLLAFPEDIVAGATSVSSIIAYGFVGHMITAACAFYLEALRKPILGAVIMYGGVMVNGVLNLALVAGWWGMTPMGAEGVAWATTGTRVLLVVVFLIAVAMVTPAFRRSVRGPASEWRRQLAVGSGGAISNAAEWGGFNFTFAIATWISVVTASAYGLAIQLLGICFMMFMGLGSATSVRVAEAFGRGDGDGVRAAARLGVWATLLAGCALAAVLYVSREPMAAFMLSANPGEAMEGVRIELVLLIGLIALIVPFDGLQATASMALRAQEIVWSPAIIHIGSYFVIMIPAAWYFGLTLNGGAEGLFLGVLIGSAVAGLGQWFWLERKAARRFPATPPQ